MSKIRTRRGVHTQFIKEVKTKQRKNQMAAKARELLSDYRTDKEFTTFTDLDGEEIKTAIKAVIDAD
jgi:hypothetical protein